MSKKLDYVAFNATSQNNLNELKIIYSEIMTTLEEAHEAVPECDRSVSQAMLHLEESFMWVGKAIRDIQLAKTRE